VVPICRRLEAEDDVTVKSIDPNADGWFDTEDHPVLAATRRDRLAAARAGFDMGVPFNELNRAFDLGFKPLPWGDRGYVPSAMQPAGAGNPRAEGRNPSSWQSATSRNPKSEGASSDAFTRLAAALNIDGKRLRAEDFREVSGDDPEGGARLVGNGQTAFVVGRNAGSAGLKGGAPSAKEQPDQ